MKTTAWAPSPDIAATEFSIDEAVVFYSAATNVEHPTSLVSSLTAGAIYASLGLSFEVRKSSGELLTVFEPGSAVSGYPAIRQSLMDIAEHLDWRVQDTINKTVGELNVQLQAAFEAGFTAGIAFEPGRAQGASAAAAPGELPETVQPSDVRTDPPIAQDSPRSAASDVASEAHVASTSE